MQSLGNIFWLGTKELRSFMRDFVLLGLVVYAFSLAVIAQAQSSSQEVHNASIERRQKLPDRFETAIRMTFAAMPSGLVEAIGAAGAVLTTLCWVPQAAKIIRERDTRAISLPGTTLCVIGVLLWLVYGLAIVDGPLIGSSIVTFAMTFIILVLKIRHG